MATFQSIVILTGAGLSAESGLATFVIPTDLGQVRLAGGGDARGLPGNPGLVHEFYNMRRRAHREVRPNAAHHALARLEREFEGRLTIVTQNVDHLHEQAGSRNLIHMHGEALKALSARCARCARRGRAICRLPRCVRRAGMRGA